MALLVRSPVNISSADDGRTCRNKMAMNLELAPSDRPSHAKQARWSRSGLRREPSRGQGYSNMHRIFGIISFAICLTPTPAFAAWAKMDTAENGAVLYLETSNIGQANSHPRVWQKIDLTRVRGSTLKEVIVLSRIDCDAQTSAQLSMTTINMQGRVTNSTTPESLATEKHIIPESNEWLVFVIACAEYNAVKSEK